MIYRLHFDTEEALQDPCTWQYASPGADPVIARFDERVDCQRWDRWYRLHDRPVLARARKRGVLVHLQPRALCRRGERHVQRRERLVRHATGFRDFEVSGTSFQLNGQDMFFTGLTYHETSPINGRTFTPQQIFTDLMLIKAMNANLIRAHYPLHPLEYLYGAARHRLLGGNPLYRSNDSTFTTMLLRGTSKSMFLEMVFRDLNCPVDGRL